MLLLLLAQFRTLELHCVENIVFFCWVLECVHTHKMTRRAIKIRALSMKVSVCVRVCASKRKREIHFWCVCEKCGVRCGSAVCVCVCVWMRGAGAWVVSCCCCAEAIEWLLSHKLSHKHTYTLTHSYSNRNTHRHTYSINLLKYIRVLYICARCTQRNTQQQQFSHHTHTQTSTDTPPSSPYKHYPAAATTTTRAYR